MSVTIPPPTQPLTDRKDLITVPWYQVFRDVNSALPDVETIYLTADKTFWVSTSGSDTTGNGDATNPFATPQGAYDYCVKYVDAQGYFIKIRMTAGPFTATTHRRATDEFSSDKTVVTLSIPVRNCPCVEFEGVLSGGVAGYTVWEADGGLCAFIAASHGLYRFQGIKFKDSTGTSSTCIFAFNMATFSIQDCDFSTGFTQYHMHIGPNTIVKAFGGYDISGSVPVHLWLECGAKADIESGTITLNSTPAFTSFCRLDGEANMVVLLTTFAGTATGKRYLLTESSLSTSYPDTYLPGDALGTNISVRTGRHYNARTYANRPTVIGTSEAIVAYITDATTNAFGAAIIGGSTYSVMAVNKGSTVWTVMG